VTQEIIEMARDSGMELYGLGKDRARFVHHLVAFANLVAAKALAENAMRETQRLGQEIEQKPVGMVKDLFTYTAWEKLDVRGSTKVYLDTPPQRTWVGLTDEDMADITSLPIGTCAMMLKVEAKLKEKNQ
jgi:hypothetical protein